MKIKVEKRPMLGDARRQPKFAWLPIRVNDTIVWFESYIKHERFIAGRYGNCWVTISTELDNDSNGSWVS